MMEQSVSHTTSERSGQDSVPPICSVIVPCYNERDGIESVLADLESTLSLIGPHELIVVDDGSDDGTEEILDRLAETLPIRIVRHDSNRGYGAALKTGIRIATAPRILIIDADGTYPVDRIPDLLAEATEADMVVGARTGDDVTYSKVRAIPKIFLRRYCCWLANRDIPDINSGLRVFRRDVALRFLRLLPDTFSFTTTITLCFMRNDYIVKYLPINYAARTGRSKIRPIRDTLRFMQLIVRTGMYFAPLRVLMPIAGLFFAGFLISIAYDIFVIVDLTEKTMLLLMIALNTAMFGLLADMIDKRNGH